MCAVKNLKGVLDSLNRFDRMTSDRRGIEDASSRYYREEVLKRNGVSVHSIDCRVRHRFITDASGAREGELRDHLSQLTSELP